MISALTFAPTVAPAIQTATRARARRSSASTFSGFLDRFSSIVRPRAKPARLELLDYESSDSVQAAIDRYTAKELDIQSAVELVKPSDRRNG